MDNRPVAKRTRAMFYGEMLETHQRNSKKAKIRERNGNAGEEERESDRVIIDVFGDDGEEAGNRRGFVDSEEKRNLNNGETSRRGSEKTSGSLENPIFIDLDGEEDSDDDDDDDDEGDSEALDLSSESGDESSDGTYEGEDDDETGHYRGRRRTKESVGTDNGTEDGESDSEDDSDDEVWLLEGFDKQEEKKIETMEVKRPKGSSKNEVSDDDTDDELSSCEGSDMEEEERERMKVKRPRKASVNEDRQSFRAKSNPEASSSETEDGEPGSEKVASAARKARPPPKMAAKRKKTLPNLDQILLNSIEQQECLEKLVPDSTQAHVDLPLKFTFTEKSDPPEKSDFDKECDDLWSVFDVSLAVEQISSSANDQVECESELDEDALCKMGKHQNHVLEEQIGIICKNCGAVISEIQYVMPSFDQNPRRHSSFRFPERGRHTPFFGEPGCRDSGLDEPLTDVELRSCADTVWDVIPGAREDMFPHQREGFEFIWRHVAGGIHREHMEGMERFSGDTGCIISHAPGTGKSRLAIVFLQSYMRLHSKCLPVIIAPRSMLLPWEEEFRKWRVDIPFHNLNLPDLSGKEDEKAASIVRRSGYCRETSTVRMLKFYSWAKGGSVLGLSYQLFEKLAGAGGQFRKLLLTLPGVVVLDEGHVPRNNGSLIWKALARMRTRKRIVLSGTPFQNNLFELYNTMCVVNPRLSGRQEAWASSARSRRRDGEAEPEPDAAWLKQIKSFIDPLVHIHRGDVLEVQLPGLRESIVVLKPSELQERLLRGIAAATESQVQLEHAVSLVSIHPSLALVLGSSPGLPLGQGELEGFRLDRDAGVKTRFLVGLIRLCRAMNERALVFSQYIKPLQLVREHLKAAFSWDEGKEILYIDGKSGMRERQTAINRFNDPKSEAKVLLASTKAAKEGINLVGASRVVFLDVVWNPSVERQATRRAYRLGQKKFVYTYHLLASGTMEENKYSRQAAKDRMSNLVFSSSSSVCGQNRGPKSPLKIEDDRVLDEMVRHEELRDIFENISIRNKDLNLVEDQAAAPSEVIFERKT